MRNATTNRGTSSLEVLVAFTLLSSVLSLALPLVVRHGRLLTEQRAYRVALDELSNQLDRLADLSPEEAPAALEQLVLSEFATARLAGAKLSGDSEPADVGVRVTLRLVWDGPHRRRVSLAAWVFPTSELSDEPTRGEEAL